MTYTDRRPLQGQPVTAKITRSNNNRFGAVLSAIYGFWITRSSGTTGPRRDAYSVITFESSPQVRGMSYPVSHLLMISFTPLFGRHKYQTILRVLRISF